MTGQTGQRSRYPNWRATRSIAVTTIREAIRSRLVAVWLLLVIIAIGAQMFVGALSMMQGQTVTLSIVAPICRALAVMVTASFVIASVSREMSERGIEIIFSAPIPRVVWVFGRLGGFSLISTGTALCAALPLAINANLFALSVWTFSLAAELILVAAIALMVSVAIVRMPLALMAFMAVYVCARMIGVIQMLQQSDPLEGSGSIAPSGWLIEALAALLPRLDLLTRTEWLVESVSSGLLSALSPVLIQVPVFAGIAIVVAAIDLHRRHV
jgi:hypothetical protein